MTSDEEVLMPNFEEVVADACVALVAAKKGALKLKTPRDPEKLRQYRAKSKAKKAAAKKAPKRRGKGRKLPQIARKRAIPVTRQRGPKGFTNSGMPRVGNEAWGRKIAKARQFQNMTQQELAEKVGIKQPHMCNVEKGTFKASAKLKAALEAILFGHVGLSKKHKTAPK